MNLNPDQMHEAAQTLLAQLSIDESFSLTDEEIALLRTLVEQFASDQVTILAMQRRLDRLEQSADRTDRFLTAGIGLLSSRLNRADILSGYDVAAARQARQDLADALARSDEPAQVWNAALDTLLKLTLLL